LILSKFQWLGFGDAVTGVDKVKVRYVLFKRYAIAKIQFEFWDKEM
jgi:hypothetical protein